MKDLDWQQFCHNKIIFIYIVTFCLVEVAPHITGKVNFPASEKDLGAMVKKAIDLADPNVYEEQNLSNQCIVKFYQTPRTVVAQLRQHLGSEVCEYVDPQVWAEDATQVGCVCIDPIRVAL